MIFLKIDLEFDKMIDFFIIEGPPHGHLLLPNGFLFIRAVKILYRGLKDYISS